MIKIILNNHQNLTKTSKISMASVKNQNEK